MLQRQAITCVRQKPPLPTARITTTQAKKNLEDHPDHHEEIQIFTPLDILTFYIWNRFFTDNFADFTIFIFIFNLITCIRTTSRSTDVQQITSPYQIAYVQRIRCIKNSPSNI
jgi:hypothetical protein